LESLLERLVGKDDADVVGYSLLLAGLLLAPDDAVEGGVGKDHVEDVPDLAFALVDLRGEEDGGGDDDLHLVVVGA